MIQSGSTTRKWALTHWNPIQARTQRLELRTVGSYMGLHQSMATHPVPLNHFLNLKPSRWETLRERKGSWYR